MIAFGILAALLAMGLTAWQVERIGVADWAELRAAVADSAADLKAVDAWVVDALPVVA